MHPVKDYRAPGNPQVRGIKKAGSEELAAVLGILDEAEKYAHVFGPHIHSDHMVTRRIIESVLAKRNESASADHAPAARNPCGMHCSGDSHCLHSCCHGKPQQTQNRGLGARLS